MENKKNSKEEALRIFNRLRPYTSSYNNPYRRQYEIYELSEEDTLEILNASEKVVIEILRDLTCKEDIDFNMSVNNELNNLKTKFIRRHNLRKLINDYKYSFDRFITKSTEKLIKLIYKI